MAAPAPRIRLTKKAGDVTLALSCDPELKDKANWALDGLAQLPKSEGPLVDGKIVRFGWSAFTLKAKGNELVVHEPDFDHDPLHDLREDVSVSLRVQGQMLAGAKKADVEPQLPAFYDKIAAQKDWLEAPWLVMARRLNPEIASSRWLILAKDSEPGELIQFAVWQLLFARPSLLSMLGLPDGAQVIVEKDTIRQVELPPR